MRSRAFATGEHPAGSCWAASSASGRYRSAHSGSDGRCCDVSCLVPAGRSAGSPSQVDLRWDCLDQYRVVRTLVIGSLRFLLHFGWGDESVSPIRNRPKLLTASARSLAFLLSSAFSNCEAASEAALRSRLGRCADDFDSEIRIRRPKQNREKSEAPKHQRPDDSVLIEDSQPRSTSKGIPERRPAGREHETSRQRPSEPLGATR